MKDFLIKYFIKEDEERTEYFKEKKEDAITATLILSAKSLHISNILYDIIEHIVDNDNSEIQITLKER